MAPKGKAASKPVSASKVPSKAPSKAPSAAKAEPGAKEAAGEKPKIDPALLLRHKRIFVTCGILSAVSLAVMIVFALKYLKLKERRRPIDGPFKELRSSLANAVSEPQFLYSPHKDVADEVEQLWSKISDSDKLYEKRKKQYRDLFQITARSSSGPWQFHRMGLYYFSKGEKNWYEAEDFCISRGAHLASILNNDEQNFISSQLQHTSWIGLRVENEAGKWRWSDGSRLEKEYWSEGQPSHTQGFRKSNQDCAMMVPSLRYHNWKDNNCHKLYRWICKESMDLEEQ